MLTERPEISVTKGYLQVKPSPGAGSKVNIPAGPPDFDLCVGIIYRREKPDGGVLLVEGFG
jgi:hypothetical protein